MAPAGKNNPKLQERVAAAAEVGLGPNSNWAQINEARRQREEMQQRQAQQAAYQARVAAAQKQVEDYNRQLAERMNQIRERQVTSSPQAEQPPEAQSFSAGTQSNVQTQRNRRGGNRGSLLAGNTGGYNPATGGGRLGGQMRSLLG